MNNFKQTIDLSRTKFFDEQNYHFASDDLVKSSWRRCLDIGLNHKEKLIFTPVARTDLKVMQEQESLLIDCFSNVIEKYYTAIKQADYLAVLTNNQGIALDIKGDIKNHDKVTQNTFRPGICFSEEQIGTNAMGCAIKFQKEISVVGGEHYIEFISGFQCSAAPILDSSGDVLGTVDLSRRSEKADCGSKLLASTIAFEIEKKLFLTKKGFIKLEVNLAHEYTTSQINNAILLLNFNEDGLLLSSCSRTKNRLDLGRFPSSICFEDIFDLSFDEFLPLKFKKAPVAIKLNSGLDVIVNACHYNPTPSFPIKTEEREADSVPDFGDPDINRKLDRGLLALKAKLPILISGETGTGKDVFAQTLYQLSNLKGPIVALNCSAIPENLVESELFGYDEGAFTGAKRGGSRGKIEQAHNGILFLDEIGEMPLTLQAQLLRVLESGEVTRLGSEQKRTSTFQLVSASHKDLLEAVNQGHFRQDLYYRIKGLNLHLSPLRQRPQLNRFIGECAYKVLGNSILSTEALHELCAYDWPGNVRELINSLKVLKVFSNNKAVINVEDLPSEMFSYDIQRHSKGSLPDLEHSLIIDALIKHNGHVPSAALDLRLSRATLYRKIHSLRINVEEFRNQ